MENYPSVSCFRGYSKSVFILQLCDVWVRCPYSLKELERQDQFCWERMKEYNTFTSSGYVDIDLEQPTGKPEVVNSSLETKTSLKK